MKCNNVRMNLFAGLSFWLVATMVFAAQDRLALKSPDGIGSPEFRGYERWESVAPSRTGDGIRVIVTNPVMIKACKEGVPNNGGAFPEDPFGAKIEWSKVTDPESPYPVDIPRTVKSVAFIGKDSKRFPDTNRWGYAEFTHDAASAALREAQETAARHDETQSLLVEVSSERKGSSGAGAFRIERVTGDPR
jgi:Cytochrome P460